MTRTRKQFSRNRGASENIFLSVVAAFGFIVAGCSVVSAATTVLPNDPNIQYMGRVDFSTPTAPVFGWAATTITVNFQGTSLQGIFRDSTGRDYLQVMIDGVLSPTVIQPSKTATTAFGPTTPPRRLTRPT